MTAREKQTSPLTHILDSKVSGANSNYVYVVHAIKTHGTKFDEAKAHDTVKMIVHPSRFFRASLVGQLDVQEAMRRLGSIGLPIRQTMINGASFGLIVNPARSEDLYVSHHADLGSPHAPSDLGRFAIARRGKTESARKLLTEPMIQNEMIWRGNFQNSINGIFVLRGNTGNEDQSLNLRLNNAVMFKDFLRWKVGREVPIIITEPYLHRPAQTNYPTEIRQILSP